MLRSKPQRCIPELQFGYPLLRKFSKSFWEKLGFFLESLGWSQRQLWHTKLWQKFGLLFLPCLYRISAEAFSWEERAIPQWHCRNQPEHKPEFCLATCIYRHGHIPINFWNVLMALDQFVGYIWAKMSLFPSFIAKHGQKRAKNAFLLSSNLPKP